MPRMPISSQSPSPTRGVSTRRKEQQQPAWTSCPIALSPENGLIKAGPPSSSSSMHTRTHVHARTHRGTSGYCESGSPKLSLTRAITRTQKHAHVSHIGLLFSSLLNSELGLNFKTLPQNSGKLVYLWESSLSPYLHLTETGLWERGCSTPQVSPCHAKRPIADVAGGTHPRLAHLHTLLLSAHVREHARVC